MSTYSKLTAQGNYIITNKTLIKKLGLECAVLLAELADEESYWNKKNDSTSDYFYSTVNHIEEVLGFKVDKQRSLISKLSEMNLIDVKYQDMPPKRYVKLNDKEIFKIL